MFLTRQIQTCGFESVLHVCVISGVCGDGSVRVVLTWFRVSAGFARYPMVGYIYKVSSTSSDEIWLWFTAMMTHRWPLTSRPDETDEYLRSWRDWLTVSCWRTALPIIPWSEIPLLLWKHRSEAVSTLATLVNCSSGDDESWNVCEIREKEFKSQTDSVTSNTGNHGSCSSFRSLIFYLVFLHQMWSCSQS